MEIHTVILLLLLCVSSSTRGQPADVMRRYQNFLNQHRGPGVTVEMCTSEISRRNIRGPAGECKPVNTFIQAKDRDIRAVCGRSHNYKLFGVKKAGLYIMKEVLHGGQAE
ncbi:Ribonuclease-like 3 [Labeo rohita]|uniref:Ribonuclease-like 3 n=1 Tax=Labeo rohita TaxID=84645 RepID=A0ABQ8LB04_LABRO|nr:Ribonuclease-like 3 [Labeo rohita]